MEVGRVLCIVYGQFAKVGSFVPVPLFGGGHEWLVLQIHEFHHGPPLWSLFLIS